jgi:hypothetical protein
VLHLFVRGREMETDPHLGALLHVSCRADFSEPWRVRMLPAPFPAPPYIHQDLEEKDPDRFLRHPHGGIEGEPSVMVSGDRCDPDRAILDVFVRGSDANVWRVRSTDGGDAWTWDRIDGEARFAV